MSSEDNLLFSKTTSKRSSEDVPSLDIDNEEGIDVQSVMVSESALDDAVSISSIQESLMRQSPLVFNP